MGESSAVEDLATMADGSSSESPLSTGRLPSIALRLASMAVQMAALLLLPFSLDTRHVLQHASLVLAVNLVVFVAGFELHLRGSRAVGRGVAPRLALAAMWLREIPTAIVTGAAASYLVPHDSGLTLLIVLWVVTALTSIDVARLLLAARRHLLGSAVMFIRVSPPAGYALAGLAGVKITLPWLLGTWIAGGLCATAVGLGALWRDDRVGRFDGSGLLRLSLPFLASSIALRVLLSVDGIAFGHFVSRPSVGYVVTASAVLSGIAAAYDAVILIPGQARMLADASNSRRMPAVLTSMQRETAIMLALGALGMVVAPLGLWVFWGRPSFPIAVWAMLSVATVVLLATNPYHCLLVAVDKGSVLARLAAAAAVVAVVGGWISVGTGVVLGVAISKLAGVSILGAGRLLPSRRSDRFP